MSTTKHFDYIIAGAGAAGLSLVHAILSSPALRSKKILLVDQNLSPASDKTWSFWVSPSHPITKMTSLNWSDVTVSAYENDFSSHLNRLKYYCIQSGAYTERLLKIASDSPQVTTLKARISRIIEDDSRVCVETDGGNFYASWCFQSVIASPLSMNKSQSNAKAGMDGASDEIRLLQHFMGWEIEVKKPLFNQENVTLMDFDTPQKSGVTFFYVLPFSTTYALVEFTMFSDKMLSDSEYEIEIRQYLKNKFGLTDVDYTLVRKEIGAIPMESTRFSGWLNSKTLSIGMVGGHTKPSTGYTFMRIQNQIQAIVDCLENGKVPVHYGSSSYRFRVYDIMLLSILAEDAKMGVRIFHDLFKKNSMELIFKFLDEKTNFFEEIKIFSTLPYIPFLKSIYRMRSRILSGA